MTSRQLILLVILIATTRLGQAGPSTGSRDFALSIQRLLDEGDREGALKLADEALAANPKDAKAFASRAAVHDARKEYDAALRDFDSALSIAPGGIALHQRRGEDRFRLGRFKESVADFDEVIRLDPRGAPYHWQRGISLYYAGDFIAGAKQFESHRAVNPDDVENAVWHFLCVARASGLDAAKRSLIPIQGDARVPMMRIHALFAGQATPADVIKDAEAADPPPEERNTRLFYAHLYLGLFEEASGHAELAREHIRLANDTFKIDGYMADVARVHVARLATKPLPATRP